MSLLNQKYQYLSLIRENQNGQRLYLCPNGEKLPSVTTILSKTKSIESIQALNAWKNRVGHTKAAEITTMAAGRGTRMHKFLEDYIAQGYLNEPGTNPYSQQSHQMAKLVIEQGLSKVNEIWGSEVSLYFPGLYSGTTDAVGIHEDQPAIIDFKQSNKFKKREYIEDYFLQIASYALCHNELYQTNIQRGVVLIAVAGNDIGPGQWATPNYQEFIIEGDEFKHYTNLWLDRVEQFYQINK